MWKIFIEYPDKSKLTLTGKGKDIPFRLAVMYYNQYCLHATSAVYQQYPKKKYEPINLSNKILQMNRERED